MLVFVLLALALTCCFLLLGLWYLAVIAIDWALTCIGVKIFAWVFDWKITWWQATAVWIVILIVKYISKGGY